MISETIKTGNRRRFFLLAVSFLSLFQELMLIRWIGSEIRIFAYFRNLALISCFLGLGLGFNLRRPRLDFLFSLVLILLLAGLAHPAAEIHGVGFRLISNYLTFPEYNVWDMARSTTLFKLCAGYLMIAAVVIMLAGVFVPFGQVLGEIFSASGNRLHDYSLNLFGSLLGIWVFTLLSYLSTPPWLWFLLGAAGLAACVPGARRKIWGLGLLIPILLLTNVPDPPWTRTFWSPYQKLQISRLVDRSLGEDVAFYHVLVNSVGYMLILDLSPAQFERYPQVFNRQDAPYYPYDLPYRFQPRPSRVLIVGAGAGNDVAAALRNGAAAVDAVEIDRRIAWFGRRFHPEAPYQDPRVHLDIDDARSFFKTSRRRYDLILFALLDSHTLTSSFSNINLDSYVYTRESLAEAKALLAPGGVLGLSFYVEPGHWWIGAKLEALVEEVFGAPPLILDNYSRAKVRGTGGILFLCGDPAALENRLRTDPELARRLADRRFTPETFANFTGRAPISVPTDDWPYLYLQRRQVPTLYLILTAVLLGLMILLVRVAFPAGRLGPSHFLFLGAGFMLVEVHSITKAALLFGSTWLVNTVMISAILIMLLMSNLVVLRFRVEKMRWWYAGLFASLLASYLLPVSHLLVGGYLLRGLLAGGFYALPMFFAGVIFAASFKKTAGVEAAFAANLLGSALGGMLESAAFLFGLKFVVLIATVLYAGSALALRRLPLGPARPDPP